MAAGHRARCNRYAVLLDEFDVEVANARKHIKDRKLGAVADHMESLSDVAKKLARAARQLQLDEG